MRINRTLGLALTAAVLAVAMTGCSNSASSTASSTASSAASSEAASSVAASSEAAESEAAAASVVSTEDLDVNGTTYSADCYGEFTLSNGDTMKLWKVNGAYADLSALPMKGMAEEFPIEAEAEQIYVADVTSNGETTRQFHTRVMDAVQRIAQQYAGKTVLVVTHGGVLDMVWRTAQGLGLDGPRQSDIPNAGLNRVRVQGGAIEVLHWVDTRHLQDLPAQPVYDQTKLVVR